jgi:elongator complex protein 1
MIFTHPVIPHPNRLRYRAAFLGCRRHRIDLNILYDHNPVVFKANLAEFISQIKAVDYLNLFLSGLKEDDVTKTMYKPLVPAEATPLIV